MALEPDRRPDRCQCHAHTWPVTRPIPPVCRTYVQPRMNGRCHCSTCSHDPECHGVVRSPSRRGSKRQAITLPERAS
jgi:hypothetical protein